MTSSPLSAPSIEARGILYGLLAYIVWGIFPIYWKLLASVSPLEVLCHRMLWSGVFLLIILGVRGELRHLFTLGQSPDSPHPQLTLGRSLLGLGGTAVLLSCNWGIYIYAITIDRIVEGSLGYFINPLISTLLGCLVLGERLSRLQGIAVGLATVGVLNFMAGLGSIPWIALTLATSFACYGLFRKLIPVSPLLGVTIETLLLTPIALFWLSQQPANAFGSSGSITFLLCFAGIITAVPLLCFNAAAKLLPLSTVGFLQYLAPSLQLLIGVFLYGEPFSATHLLSFSLIWIALGLYSTHLIQGYRANA